ncbi:hypothetical protein [Promicromonospora panici]|uniref:hypothetical protein n=1 Tax=Promicromonospora panici TaxID=2219658 RepID=UPI00101B5C00|nr:hypothetical protein [Promicromonospora panici]
MTFLLVSVLPEVYRYVSRCPTNWLDTAHSATLRTRPEGSFRPQPLAQRLRVLVVVHIDRETVTVDRQLIFVNFGQELAG